MSRNSDLHFILPKNFKAHLEVLPDQKIGRDYPYWLGGRFNWVAQSYLMLREYIEGVTIGLVPVSGKINFAHVMTWRELKTRAGEFRVSVRADYPQLFNVDFEILQNPRAPLQKRQAYLPYWPVPGIIPRDVSRQSVETIAYAGRLGKTNLDGTLRARGGKIGALKLQIIEPNQWHDLSEVDILLAIRTFDRKTHDSKPPSKLFSAWMAGVPLIAGFDSAFSTVGVPGSDYIRISTEAELIASINKLISDTDFYSSIVSAGLQRSKNISHHEIAKVWIDCLRGPITSEFESWRETGPGKFRTTIRSIADDARSAGSHLKNSLTNIMRNTEE